MLLLIKSADAARKHGRAQHASKHLLYSAVRSNPVVPVKVYWRTVCMKVQGCQLACVTANKCRLCHAGTAIETNINGQFKFTLHKQASLPAMLQGLNYPLLENANEYVVHGFTVSVS